MGKWTDKSYITHSEWTRDFGGTTKRKAEDYKRLPYNFCALSLAPFEDSVCTEEGIVFDVKNILPFVKKFGVNPVTGAPLTVQQLIPLRWYKNAEGSYHDPITYKTFNDTTHIVVIKPSGNVYSMDTIDRLNAKTKQWTDLISEEPFTRKDIISLQDPTNLDYKRDFSKFYHVINDVQVNAEEEAKKRKDPSYRINLGESAERVLKLLPKDEPASQAESSSKQASSSLTSASKPVNVAHFSTGAVSASATSTAVTVATRNEAALWNMDDVMYSQIKKKGYVRLVTNLGDLNLELHCDLTPMTCHNFILLAQQNYYKDTKFHRSIKNFMLQGGDPTGTGTGGESYWKSTFKDEFRYNLSHNARGVVSMANSGRNTNKSQFFITYRPCTHLDRKHTIFGKVVGGLDVLSKMEEIETDAKDRPKQPIILKDVHVFINPFEEWKKNQEAKDKKLAEEEEAKRKKIKTEEKGAWFSNPSNRKRSEGSTGVGRYLNSNTTAKVDAVSSTTADGNNDVPIDEDVASLSAPVKKRTLKSDLTDFSAW